MKTEKDVFEILALFEQELEEKLQESKGEIERVKYYEKFSINKIGFENIFITTEKDVDGNITYHVYSGSSSNELITVDSEGNVKIKNDDLKKYIDEFDLDKVIEENEKTPGNLKGKTEKAQPKEMEEVLEQNEQHNEVQQVEQDLNEHGEDLEISKYRPIKDAHVDERMPDVFKDGTENGVAYSNKLHRFVMISKENGQYKINENVEPARMTWKTIISIDSNGESVERKVPYALMKTNRPDQEIAVTIDDFGYVDIETVKVLPCQERISREVRTQGEAAREEESLEVRREFETQGINYEHDIAHQVEEIEEAQKDENKTVDHNITPDDYIPNTEITWGELMEKTGDPLPTLIERYTEEMKDKKPEDSQKVVEEIEADYEMVNHERQHYPN